MSWTCCVVHTDGHGSNKHPKTASFYECVWERERLVLFTVIEHIWRIVNSFSVHPFVHWVGCIDVCVCLCVFMRMRLCVSVCVLSGHRLLLRSTHLPHRNGMKWAVAFDRFGIFYYFSAVPLAESIALARTLHVTTTPTTTTTNNAQNAESCKNIMINCVTLRVTDRRYCSEWNWKKTHRVIEKCFEYRCWWITTFHSSNVHIHNDDFTFMHRPNCVFPFISIALAAAYEWWQISLDVNVELIQVTRM